MFEKLIYQSAVEKPAGERHTFVQAVCGKRGALRECVESLIETHDEMTGNCDGQTISLVLTQHQRDLLSNRPVDPLKI